MITILTIYLLAVARWVYFIKTLTAGIFGVRFGVIILRDNSEYDIPCIDAIKVSAAFGLSAPPSSLSRDL